MLVVNIVVKGHTLFGCNVVVIPYLGALMLVINMAVNAGLPRFVRIYCFCSFLST